MKEVPATGALTHEFKISILQFPSFEDEHVFRSGILYAIGILASSQF
jgi:hypothetical protein